MHIQAEKEAPESARSTATRSTTASFHSLTELDLERKRENSGMASMMSTMTSTTMSSSKNVSSSYAVPPPRPSRIPSKLVNGVVLALKNGSNNSSREGDGQIEKLQDISLQADTGVSKRIGSSSATNRVGAGAANLNQNTKVVGGSEKWDKADIMSINTPDKWEDDMFVERKHTLAERQVPKPAFIPSRRVWGRTVSTAMWIILGAGIGFLLGTLCSIITVKATEVVPSTFFIVPVRYFCEPTEPDGFTYARKRVEGGQFPNTFVTMTTKMGIVQMQVLGVSVFDLQVDTCHVEIQTINSVIEVLRKTHTILYTRHDGGKEILPWDEAENEPDPKADGE